MSTASSFATSLNTSKMSLFIKTFVYFGLAFLNCQESSLGHAVRFTERRLKLTVGFGGQSEAADPRNRRGFGGQSEAADPRNRRGFGGQSEAESPVKWCDREDLNLHALRHQSLKLACLPIPPRSHLNTINKVPEKELY